MNGIDTSVYDKYFDTYLEENPILNWMGFWGYIYFQGNINDSDLVKMIFTLNEILNERKTDFILYRLKGKDSFKKEAIDDKSLSKMLNIADKGKLDYLTLANKYIPSDKPERISISSYLNGHKINSIKLRLDYGYIDRLNEGFITEVFSKLGIYADISSIAISPGFMGSLQSSQKVNDFEEIFRRNELPVISEIMTDKLTEGFDRLYWLNAFAASYLDNQLESELDQLELSSTQIILDRKDSEILIIRLNNPFINENSAEEIKDIKILKPLIKSIYERIYQQ